MAAPEVREITMAGLTDLHVHPRDFAQSYKEDFESCTQAALASGVTTVAAMPNYEPALEVRPYNLQNMFALHRRTDGHRYTDVMFWASAQPEYDNVRDLAAILPLAVGIKFYIEPTQGNDTLYAVRAFEPVTRQTHELNPKKVIAAHAEDDTIEETIGMIAGDYNQPLLIPHVNNRFVLDAILRAKAKDLPVFAEVCPHHLFMTEADVETMGWRARMKPPLGSLEDQEYLWANIDKIDTIGTDHAPHTVAEKDEADRLNPEGLTGEDDMKSYGVPGLDAMLPLLLHEVMYGYTGKPRLTFNQLFKMTNSNPRKLVGLPTANPHTIKVSTETYEFSEADVRSKAGWSPYIGRTVTGKVTEVKMRGKVVYDHGTFSEPSGQILTSGEA
jgi:dihydroorotase-like cyclic amidohydrolase